MRPLVLALAGLLALPLLASAAHGGPAVHTYSGAGTVVTSFSPFPGTAQLTALDNGAVVCRDADGDGIHESGVGGTCLRFDEMGAANALHAHDDAVRDGNLAFQACVDNSGDGVCSGDGERGAYDPAVCADRIFFSHSTSGFTVNPLGVGPASARAFFEACGAKGFPGFIVILCAGAHDNALGTDPHAHRATTGVVTPATAQSVGGGNYCGGATAAKAYTLVQG